MIQKLLYVLLIVLAGCRKDHSDRTPAGWHIDWHDQGTIATGLHTLGEIHDLFDSAMIRACQHNDKYFGFPAGTCEAKLRKDDPEFEIRDNFAFPVLGRPIDFPNAKYASGETMNRFWVILAFYNQASSNSSDPASVPSTAPPWTKVFDSTPPGDWFWGVETAGLQFPALDYELHWFFSQDSNFQ